MASIIVRGLDDRVKEQLAEQARHHGRSMEAEVRAILSAAVQRPNIAEALLEAAQRVGGLDLEVPPRADEARTAVFECSSSTPTSFRNSCGQSLTPRSFVGCVE